VKSTVGVSIIIAVFNQLKDTKSCLHDLEKKTILAHDFIIIDNGSTDGTKKYFEKSKGIDFKYLRNEANLGHVAACNQGARLSRYPILCFIHNDVTILKKGWLKMITHILEKEDSIGLAGLYGHQKMRKDGSCAGRTLVRGGNLKSPFVNAVDIDSLCLIMKKSFFDSMKGFEEIYRMHGFCQDFSLKSMKAGYRNIVVNIPFIHRSGTTRRSKAYRKIVSDDDELRRRNKEIFMNRWGDFLPVDVRTRKEKVFGWLLKVGKKNKVGKEL